jgi:hypothetical protein
MQIPRGIIAGSLVLGVAWVVGAAVLGGVLG